MCASAQRQTDGSSKPIRKTSRRVLALSRLAAIALAIALFWPPGSGLAQERAPGERSTPATALRQINIGFVRHAYGTWTAQIADGGFEKATGRSLRWYPYDSDSAVMAALAGGRLEIALVGTGVVASALARGLELKLFYVLVGSTESEGMVMSPDSVFRFAEPKTLQSKVIAVPYGSAAHLRLLESLRRWGLAVSSMRIVNLQSKQIAEAWQRKEIDAAVVSEPLLSKLGEQGRLIPLPAPGGHTGLLVYVAAADFVAQHIVFLSRFVDVMSRADAAFTGAGGPIDDTRAEVRSIAFMTGLEPAEVIAAIARYRPPALDVQASAMWLGGGAESALLAELKANADTWRWGGRLTGPQADLSGVLAREPVAMALTYQR